MSRDAWFRFALSVGVSLLVLTSPRSPVAEEKQHEAMVPLEIPAPASARKNPYAGMKESIDNGQMIFSSQCVMCHGVRGDGGGELVAALDLHLPDLTDPAVQSRFTDGDLFYILSEGNGPSMTPQKDRMREDWRWHLVSYVRTLVRKK